MNYTVIITCEHATNAVPAEFQSYFENNLAILETHCAYDIGALSVYKAFITKINCQHQHTHFSRLIFDFNRTPNHTNFFSSFTKDLPQTTKQELINKHYNPYVENIRQWIETSIAAKKIVLHLSIHSFTPCLDPTETIPLHALGGGAKARGLRKNDLAFLYDSKYKLEKSFCEHWRKTLLQKNPGLQIRMNYPYRGDSNALTTYFRKLYREKNYVGIELECNQRLFLIGSPLTHQLYKLLPETLQMLVTAQ